jgi:hypothetical protein
MIVSITVTHNPYKPKTGTIEQFEGNVRKTREWVPHDDMMISPFEKAIYNTYMLLRPKHWKGHNFSSLSITDNKVRWTWPTGSYILIVWDCIAEARKYWKDLTGYEATYIDAPIESPFWIEESWHQPAYIEAETYLA